MALTLFFIVMLTVPLSLKGRLWIEGCSQDLIYRDTVLLANYQTPQLSWRCIANCKADEPVIATLKCTEEALL